MTAGEGWFYFVMFWFAMGGWWHSQRMCRQFAAQAKESLDLAQKAINNNRDMIDYLEALEARRDARAVLDTIVARGWRLKTPLTDTKH